MGRAAGDRAGKLARAVVEVVQAELDRDLRTQKDLSVMSGNRLKPTYLGRRMRGERALNLNDVEVLAATLGMSVRELIDRAIDTTENRSPAPAPRGRQA